jgi:hypothetical protein
MRSGRRPPLDEQKALFEATVAAEGATTSAGNAGGTSFIDAGLFGAGVNSFVSMMAVIHPGHPNLVDSRDITAFNNVTGEVTVASAFKGGQVAAGVPYKIVTFRFVPAEVAALQADVGDASASALGSLYGILGNPAQSFTTRTERIEEGDAVYFDSGGVAGTDYPVGTPQSPVNNVADLLAILAARGLSKVVLLSDITLTAACTGLTFIAGTPGQTVCDLNGQDVAGSTFIDLNIDGNQGAGASECFYEGCIFDVANNNGLWGRFRRCVFGSNSYTFKDDAHHYFYDCHINYSTIDWADAYGFYMSNCHVSYDDYVAIGNYSGSVGHCYAALELYGGQVEIRTMPGDQVWLYGSFMLGVNQTEQYEIYDFRQNRLVLEGHKPRPSFSEFWVSEVIDPVIWTPTDPATGTAWGVIARNGLLVARTAPNANEAARLVTKARYPVHLDYAARGMLECAILEFYVELDNVANVDNGNSFIGLTAAAGGDRTSDNIVGLYLAGDQFRAIVDSEATEDTAALTMTEGSQNLVRIEMWPRGTRFYINGVFAARLDAVSWYPYYVNVFIDTEATGGATLYIGPVRIYYLDIQFIG